MAVGRITYECVDNPSIEAMDALKAVHAKHHLPEGWLEESEYPIAETGTRATLEEVVSVLEGVRLHGRMTGLSLTRMIPWRAGVDPALVYRFLPSVNNGTCIDRAAERETSLFVRDGVYELAVLWRFASSADVAVESMTETIRRITETWTLADAYLAEQRALVDQALDVVEQDAVRFGVQRMIIQ